MADGAVSMSGQLDTQLRRSPRPHRIHSVRIPGVGRVMFTTDPGHSTRPADHFFATDLAAEHRDGDGKVRHLHDLGSGLVTNVGVLSLANDFAWASPSAAAVNTLKLQNYHAVGTGSTAAAATDIACQTLAAPTTTTAVTGAQSLVSAANVQIFRTVATVNFTTTLAITEWGLHNASALSATTGTPFTAATATSATVTATPLTASSTTVQGSQQMVVRPGTTTVWGLVLTNTTSVFTIPAWYKVADGTAGATPGNTEAYTIIPVLWDHKVFTAINVVNGDSIVFTYSLTINSGG